VSAIIRPAVPLPLSRVNEFGVFCCCPVLPLGGEQLLLGALVSSDAPSQHLALVIMEVCRAKLGTEAGSESSLWTHEAAAVYGVSPVTVTFTLWRVT
jgi:hypothetical protein